MWILKFVGGLIVGFVAVSLLLSKDFWMFLFGLIFGKKVRHYEPPEEEEEEPAPKPRPQPAVKPKDDFSEMSREELAELFRNEEVRVVKR